MDTASGILANARQSCNKEASKMNHYLVVALCSIVANFLFQRFQDAPNWESAIERSYFMCFALLMAWVYQITERKK